MTDTPTTECEIWRGTRSTQGYALIVIDGKRQLVSRLRLAEKLGRAIRPGFFACHTCNHGADGCISADHLYEGDHKDNARDAVAAGRLHWQKQTVCPNGHPYDGIIQHQSGSRVGKTTRRCDECHRQAARSYYQRNKERLAAVARENRRKDPDFGKGSSRLHLAKGTCPKGHEYTVGIRQSGPKCGSTYKFCRTCADASKALRGR